MTNEQKILQQFQEICNAEQAKANAQFEARIQELKLQPKVIRTPRKWNLNESFQITDVTPEGYGI